MATLVTKGTTLFAVNDILRLKDGTDDEWMKVTGVTDISHYTVERDKAGDYGAGANPAWKKGASITNYQQSGDGGIYQTSSETNAPYLSVFTHAGSPWSSLTTRLRIGNLNGYLGYTTDKYGIGIGESTKYLKYDPTGGLRLEGCAIKTSAGDSRLEITTDNVIEVYSGGTKYIDISVDGTRWFDASGGNMAAIKALRSPIGLQLYSYTSGNVEHSIKFYADTATQADFSSNVTNEIDLGTSSKKFKDLHLAGDAYVAGGFKGTQSFENIPTLPASDPTTNNQATRKAYVDSKTFDTAFSPENTSYFTYQLMGSADANYWQSAVGDQLSCEGGMLVIDESGMGVVSYGYVSASLHGAMGSTTRRLFSNTEKIIIRFIAKTSTTQGGNPQFAGFGLAKNFTPLYDYTDAVNECILFNFQDLDFVKSHTNNGTTATYNSITGLDVSNFNEYRIEFIPGTSAKFYVNNVLEDTITTNLPSDSTEMYFFAGITYGGVIWISPIQVSIEI